VINGDLKLFLADLLFKNTSEVKQQNRIYIHIKEFCLRN
jgi:hypothetical protein